ncbi:MAG: HAD-IA family hydrolase [Candidatus Eisenbacteria bacterium]
MDSIPKAPLPRAVFFDVGDTLLDTSAMLDAAIFTALVPIDPARSIAEVRAAVAASGATMPTRQPPFHEVRGNVDWWIERYRAIGKALGLSGSALERFLAGVTESHFGGDALHVIADAPAALARLASRGIALGVISNWDDTLESILERKGLRRFFRSVIASTGFGFAKPDRRIFEFALREIGADASQAWHVGDDPDADAIGAARAGLSALLLDPYDLYRKLERHGIARAHSLTDAVDRILGEQP